jgi:hypothetical protein
LREHEKTMSMGTRMRSGCEATCAVKPTSLPKKSANTKWGRARRNLDSLAALREALRAAGGREEAKGRSRVVEGARRGDHEDEAAARWRRLAATISTTANGDRTARIGRMTKAVPDSAAIVQAARR